MSVLVVGVSHKSAPVSVLERLTLDPSGVEKLVHSVAGSDHVLEATVLATCNRVEIYAEVDRFHGSVECVSRLLCDLSGDGAEDPDSMVPHLYVHYDDGAVSHLFHVASGLDSMVVGEGQILGQTRDALRIGQELGAVGPALNSLFQQALRVGKRARAETDIDHAAPTLVSAALALPGDPDGSVRDKRVLVLGAGTMAALAVATVVRLGAADVAVVNRTADKATRLAAEHGVRALPLSELETELATADVVICCTGATGLLVTRTMAETAVRAGGDDVRDLLVVDLAMPHDVEPEVGDLPSVTLVGLSQLGEELQASGAVREVLDVRRIVAEELTAFAAARRQASVTPTVVALRSMATAVVEAEMARLDARLPDLDPALRAELLRSVRRVADKLLHRPTVRVKELADQQGAVSYARALAELFALDPDAVDAVTRAEGLS